MTPQERDLITALFSRLQQAPNQPKDAEADALIRGGVSAQPDAPYLLVQTVLIQDMALNEAHNRIKELEQKVAAPPAQTTSFLGRGSVPSAGPWGQAAPPPAAPVWTQSGASPAPQAAQPMAPLAAPGASSGFLRQAAMTAASVAGGALLFQGIQSLFGPHYGGGFLAGTPMQPGLGETVVNNYYSNSDTPADAPQTRQADFDPGQSNDPAIIQADDSNYSDPGQDVASDQDSGGGDSFDV
jgi:uncharacterized protein